MGRKGRILIVDDEPLNVKLLAAKLPRELYETSWANSGQEALEKVAEDCPDVVLLDIMMPGMSGYEVTAKLKEDPETRDVPIILVTALDGTDNKIRGLEAGADEFLNKPVNTAELLARVKSLLRLKEYRDQLRTRSRSEEHFTARPGTHGDSPGQMDLPSVLVVDDNHKDSRLITGYLHGEPYQIDMASDGEETLLRVNREKVDVVLLDLLLPGKDGFEVCQHLKSKEETRNIQVLLITGLQDIESKVKGLEMGADDYLVKPLNVHELKARIKALVKKKAYLDGLHASYEKALHSAITDRLTGLHNNAYLKHFLELELKRSLRHRQPVALVMIDIDDFKKYNDTLGHLAGDAILRQLGVLIRENTREVDLGARYGGEEFAVVMPNTNLEGALIAAERIRRVVQQSCVTPGPAPASKKVTVSMGVAAFPVHGQSSLTIIEKADKALYAAKRRGKNQVCAFREEMGSNDSFSASP